MVEPCWDTSGQRDCALSQGKSSLTGSPVNAEAQNELADFESTALVI